MSASFVTMPKTAINKYGCFIFGENNVWFARQFADIYSIAKTFLKQFLSDKNLRFGILGVNV